MANAIIHIVRSRGQAVMKAGGAEAVRFLFGVGGEL